METIAHRLKHARQVKGWTQGDLATAAGLSQGTVGNIETGSRQAHASLIKLADALGVEYHWLAYGQGPMTSTRPRKAAESAAVYLVDHPDFPAIKRVTLKLQAGITGYIVDADPEDGPPIVFRRDWIERRGFTPHHLIAVRVRGASMEPVLFDGDTVVINTAQAEPKDGAVFAVNYEGEAVIKRMVRDAGQWWLSSDNPDRARFPRKLANHTAIIIGEVVHRQSEHI